MAEALLLHDCPLQLMLVAISEDHAKIMYLILVAAFRSPSPIQRRLLSCHPFRLRLRSARLCP